MQIRYSGIIVARGAVLAGSLATLAGCAGIGPGADAADTVLRDGYIRTVDENGTTAEALAIRDGVIVYVGDATRIDDFIGPETRVIDLEGRMVMPGLQDAHIHGITAGHPQCDLEYRPLTVEELTTRLEACLDNPAFGEAPGDWLVVDHWYVQFLTTPGTLVTKDVLDSLDTRRPIIVNGVWGHSALANSRALELADITAETPNPSDGVIAHDAAGEPTGWVYDGAQELVRQAIPAPPAVDPVEAARRGMQALIKEGVTSFQAQSESRDTVAAFAELREQHGLPARAHFLIDSGAKTGAELAAFIDELDALRDEFEHPEQLPLQVRAWRPGEQEGPRLVPEPGVSVAGVGEVMADGILQAPTQTAALLEPYRVNAGNADDPRWVPGDNRGEAYIDAETLGTMATRFAEHGYQTQIHAIGDRAVRNTLDAFEILREHDRADVMQNDGYGHVHDSRPLMSHAELVDPADHARFKQLGVVPVMSYQWAKPAPDSTDAVKPYLGPQRWAGYEPEGDLAAAGAKIAYGSDYPVDPLDHWYAIEAAVLREADWGPAFPQYAGAVNPDQALSLEAAIRGITLNAAYAMHQDEVTGSLETGKLADLLILDRNLFEIAHDDISETQVLMTMVGGDIVYTADDFAR